MNGTTTRQFEQNSTIIQSPAQLRLEFPGTGEGHACVAKSRSAVRQIMRQQNDRLVVVVGPCSIHDPEAAIAYAQMLLPIRQELRNDLEIVMRVYFEKPRTRTGWKGLLIDPDLNGVFDAAKGLRTARELLSQVTDMGIPVATEFLSPVTTHYISDLVTWGAIGARTTESQIHREMASGLPCPVGFKNSTDGNVKIAIDAIHAASVAHHLVGISDDGKFSRIETAGNPDCHVVLRGGARPNYDAPSVGTACAALKTSELLTRVVIDASHGNSGKNHENQIEVCKDIAGQIAEGENRIVGIMLESNLVAGRQDCDTRDKLVFGKSITDACIGWDDTVTVLSRLATAVSSRRRLNELLKSSTLGSSAGSPSSVLLTKNTAQTTSSAA